MTIGFVALLGIGLIVARVFGFGMPGLNGVAPQGLVSAVFDKQISLISGHAGSDSGAICSDSNGQLLLTEADVNASIAAQVAERLRRAGADVLVLEEFDDRLTGLHADVLLSLHADSCIDASGYKAARHSNSPIAGIEDRLLACIDQHYGPTTGLPRHPNTVTHDMTRYHAFNRVAATTPAAILEMGFLGGDQQLLTRDSALAAAGIADSLLCFLADAPAN
ncbi:MAG: N-acetylmuramoyl-L-alanine amidase [Caldilineaceae bacterium]|nr:N-acetylmuramoyl-L-alanine amidase [Caldilineaceae bacterium]